MTVRANDMEELKPLLAMCREGKLFQVQEWVAQGRPVALPEVTRRHGRPFSPLRVAMETGFHSLVEVLLEAGAPTAEQHYDAVSDAVSARRSDLLSLLLERGASVDSVSLKEVIEQGCDPQTIDILLGAGKNLVEGSPIAWGLINRIRPSLGLYKRAVGSHPELKRQVNIALRFHALESNAKWVALTLWAGGDPLARGPADLDWDEDDSENASSSPADYEGKNAVEWVAFRGSTEILQQKPMLQAVRDSVGDGGRLLEAACWPSSSSALRLLLENGHSPRRMPDQGTSLIARLVTGMAFDLVLRTFSPYTVQQAHHDSHDARQKMGMVNLLLGAGARWLPANKDAVAEVRRNLLRLAPAYSLEFAWLMKAHGAARRADMTELFRTPAIRRHLASERQRLDAIVLETPDSQAIPPRPEASKARAGEA